MDGNTPKREYQRNAQASPNKPIISTATSLENGHFAPSDNLSHHQAPPNLYQVLVHEPIGDAPIKFLEMTKGVKGGWKKSCATAAAGRPYSKTIYNCGYVQ